MLNFFRFNCNFKKNRKKFTHFMHYVHQFEQTGVDEDYRRRIFSYFAKAALKPIQIRHITYAYSCAKHKAPREIFIDDWFNNNAFLLDFFVPVNVQTNLLYLKHDIIFSYRLVS